MPRFVLRFRGQCSFAIPEGGKEAWVLMKDLRSPKTPKGLQGHRALLEVSAKFIAFPKGTVPRQSSLFLLMDRGILDILPGGKPLNGDLRIKDVPSSGSPDLTDPCSVDEDSFLWVAPLDLACKGAGID